MADKSIKITIATALNAAGFTAAKRAISNLVSGTKDFAKKIGGNLMNIKAGFDMIAGAASKLMQVMSKGMEFERMTVTFKSLTGSMELAKAHMKDLQDLGRTPPFSLETFAAASQMMMKMTDGMLGYKKSLEMVGDIAAATGNDISQVGRSVGLAYQMIRDGQPFGRAGSQMVQLGILTKAQVEHFDELSKSGGNNIAVWEELTKVLSKYKGAMAETEKTSKGMVEAIQGEATVAMTDFSAAITDAAKPALEDLLGWLKAINEDGSIEEWADRTVEAFGSVGEVARSVGKAFGWFWKSAKTVGAHVSAFRQGMKLADEMGLKGDARGAFARKFRSDVIDEIWGKNEEANDDRRASREQRRIEKAKRRAEQSAKIEAEAQKRIRDDMARAQEETERRNAKKPKLNLFGVKGLDDAREFVAAYEKELEDAAKKAAKAELEERRDAMKKLHDERMKQLDEEQAKVQKNIDAAKAKGFDNLMATAGGGYYDNGTLDQGNEERERRQRIIGAQRSIDAEQKLREKMAKTGATLDDPTKLGRMSNLERAAFERLKLKDQEKQAAKLQQEKDNREKQMAKDLDDINKKLKEVGL